MSSSTLLAYSIEKSDPIILCAVRTTGAQNGVVTLTRMAPALCRETPLWIHTHITVVCCGDVITVLCCGDVITVVCCGDVITVVCGGDVIMVV
jgi:hypothetical protein